MSTSLLVAKERQPGSSFGLGQKQAKNLWRKRATFAPYFEKIRRKCATVARYSMLYRVLCNALQRASQKSKKIRRKCATVARYSIFYRFLCNALQRARQKQKNTVQMRHSCTLFDAVSIFVQCSATRRRSTRSRPGFRALLLCAVPQQQLVRPPFITLRLLRYLERRLP
jgi:hypothetical protein